MKIRRVTAADVAAITALYNRFVRDTVVSFETEAVTPVQMQARVDAVLSRHDWLVAEEAGELCGYAYYSAFREREAYRGTVESTIYLAEQAVGRGLASALYGALLQRAAEQGYREVIGVITVPNERSEALHRRLGFERVGVLRRVGRKFGRDADVALWQRRLQGTAQ